MIAIKLMADYQCYPLWNVSQGEVGNIDPNDLPISAELRRELMEWADLYDSTFNDNDPSCSEFKNETEEFEFRKTSKELGSRLSCELGSGFTVITKI